MTADRVALIVVAAGAASRMNGVEKVWAPLGIRPMVWHSLSRLSPWAVQTVLVTRRHRVESARATLSELNVNLTVVEGGVERWESVRCGLAEVGQVEAIAIHDAARPFASADLFKRALRVLKDHDGVVPALAVNDTLKRIDANGRIVGTVPRSNIRGAQTPQVFWADPIRTAYAQIDPGSDLPTDDSALLEQAGFHIATVPGDQLNFKITTEPDLDYARFLIATGAVR